MIRRLAFVAGCLAISSVIFTDKVNAQLQVGGTVNVNVQTVGTVNIDVTGTVAPTCSTSNITAGVLRVANPARLTTNSSQATGASNGSFTLTCNSGAQLSLGIPIPQNDLSTNVADYGAKIVGVTSNFAKKGGSAETATLGFPFPNNRLLEVEVYVDNGSNSLPTGTYTYRVPVNITAL
ncbi:hypothetical protein [Anabaena azotica]|uniref:Spore coat protein U domain-containing protein n=1 Tax=Anabaena azotica FACHB-119 TaxID=947527 RepID=A0ABR8DAZ0_9NOST|nr:hypothetical protein [Anabaena azotica]MBD2503623.1 hypothetical protein [Anabaena azotica FACHB-119]